MTAADILGMELDQGEGKIFPLHILKKRGKVLVGLWMIFIFYLGLFHISKFSIMDIYYFRTRNKN